jgi:ribosome-binding ATPase YchF (GTP1/OBG family)
MKIYTQGLGLTGSVKLRDTIIDQLAERHRSEKRVYIDVNFELEYRERADSFLIPSDDRLDWILEDTELLERNQYNDPDHTDLCQRALATLEDGALLCENAELGVEERAYLRGLNVATVRPGRTCDGLPDDESLHRLLHELHTESGRLFFYTSGKTETRGWEVEAGATAPEAAGRIHSDLERGFIRAEVYKSSDLDQFATPQEAKSAGLLRLVDRSYVIAPGDVIDVKFNV